MMKIQKVSPRRSLPARLPERPTWYLVLLLLAVAAGFVIHQQGWHQPVSRLLDVALREPSFAHQMLFHRSRVPILTIEMNFRNYTVLLGQREQALRSGARAADETDYIPALLSVSGATSTAQLRLPEGPAMVFREDRWPLEILLNENAGLWETAIPLSPCADRWQRQDPAGHSLRHFVLVPANSNVLTLWGYLETLCRNDLLAPRAFPARLVFNGTDHGLYILQEQPTAEWLSLQGKERVRLIGWNRRKYWEAYAQTGGMMPGSGLAFAQAAEVGPLGEPITPSLRFGHNAGLPLAPEPTGRFLALTALWYGVLTPDWRALYLACDPQISQCEPVAGVALFPSVPSEAFLNDPAVQEAYARALIRFGSPDFLSQLQAELEPSLKTLQLALTSGGIYVELPWSALRQHQAAMRALVNPTIGTRVVAETTDGKISLEICNSMPFPIAIVYVDFGEQQTIPVGAGYTMDSENGVAEANSGEVIAGAKALLSDRPTCVRLQIPEDALPYNGYWYEEIRVGVRIAGTEAPFTEIPAQPAAGRTAGP